MAIIQANVCSNCHKSVPDGCNGKLYKVLDWKRLVCRGSDGDAFTDDTPAKFHVVMGHGL